MNRLFSNKTKGLFLTGSLLLLLAAANRVAAQNTFPSSGHAGIGTVSPAASLEIKTTDYIFGYSTIGGVTFDNNNVTSLQIFNSDAPQLSRIPPNPYVPGNTNDIVTVWKTSYNGSFSNRKLVAITADGKLRIGQQAANGLYANYKLSVDGDMIAKRCVIQTTSWADFVFAPDYALPSLSDVELFIKQNKHLPGIPSEAEVKENGIDMGNMDKVLLQKVEELTLYMIELQKENAKLKEKVEHLESVVQH